VAVTFNFEGGTISSDFLNDQGNPWVIQTTDVNAGTYGIEAESGNDADSSNLFLFGDFDAGDVTFYEKVSSETDFDFGRFFLENTERTAAAAQLEVSGNPGSFTQRTVAITAGVHCLQWTYTKDSVDPANDDTWYIDDIVVPDYTLVDLSDAETFATIPTTDGWTDDATYPWRTYTRKMFNATGSGRSGSITHSQTTTLTYDSDAGAPAGNAVAVFRADAEGNFDELDYIVDSVTQQSASGANGAQSGTPRVWIKAVSSGAHTYEYEFGKDGSDTQGRDQGEIFMLYAPGMGVEAAIGLAWQENAWVNAGWASGAWSTTATVTGSGTPAAQSATTSGAGTSESTGSGTPAAQASTITGAGTTETAGTGTLAADSATTSGAGTSESTGSGTPAAQSATTSGSGTVVGTIAGGGTLGADSATTSGAGTSESTGAGTPAAQASTITGAGTSESTGAGTPAAQAATITGAGTASTAGTGTLDGQAATMSGSGVIKSVGTGAIVADVADVTGEGTTSLVFGSGAPAAQAATITGAGTSASTGSGTLNASLAEMNGTDQENTYNWNGFTGRPGGDSGVAFQVKAV
jgi:hypothetical protein